MLLASLVLTVLWSRGLFADRKAPDGGPLKGLGRRRFLAGSAAGIGGLVAGVGATLGRNIGWITVTGPALAPETPKTADSALRSHLANVISAFEVARISRCAVVVIALHVATFPSQDDTAHAVTGFCITADKTMRISVCSRTSIGRERLPSWV